MNPKELVESLSLFSDYFDEKQVIRVAKQPLKLLPDTVLHVIPSITMGSDGPFLQAIFIVTESLLSEVKVSTGKNYLFDFINLSTITNIKYTKNLHSIPISDEPVEYEYTEISLFHDLSGVASLESTMTFVGASDTEWLKLVRKAFPVSLLQ